MTRFGVVLRADEPGATAAGLERSLASLRAQTTGTWAAVVCGTPAPELPDPRVRAAAAPTLAAALGLFTQEPFDYVMVLGAGDRLWPVALRRLEAWVRHLPDWLYADEQGDDRTEPVVPFRKPGWSPDYLRSTNYAGRPVLYRSDLLPSLLADGPLVSGAQEWDLALRAARRSAPVHVPLVLLDRWGGPLPAVDLAAAEQVARTAAARDVGAGQDVVVEATGHPAVFSVRRPLPADPPGVTLVVPTAGSSREVRGQPVVLVENLLASVLERTDYPAFEVVCVVDEKTPPAVADQLRRLDPRVRCLDRKGPFDFADIVNRGVAAAQTDLVLLLNDDTEVVDPDWLTRLVEVAELPGVGAVGVRLLLEDGRFQHVGVSHNPQGLPVHVQWGETRANDYFGSTYADLDYCVVTAACLLTRRSLFAQVGGFSPRFPVNYNDADFCLRLVTSGWRVVQCNAVALHHYESSSREGGVDAEEQRAYLLAWGERSFRDPWAHLFRWAGYAPVGLDAADPVAAGPGVRSSN